MMQVNKLICSCLGIGYLKGGGTFAALFACAAWYFVFRNHHNNLVQSVVVLITTLTGIWSSGRVENDWGKDNRKVVVDEVAGMCASLLLIPVQLKYMAMAFIMFRFFDIAKPLYIRNLEKLPGGWGVMADDLLAGLYTNIIMQLIILCNLF